VARIRDDEQVGIEDLVRSQDEIETIGISPSSSKATPHRTFLVRAASW